MYKYIGKAGEFVPGVPQRDLTDQEAQEYGVADHPLYKKMTKKEVNDGRD
jgi:hypothetical protein